MTKQENYNKNMQAIKKFYPEQFELLNKAEDVGWFEEIKSLGGTDNILLKHENRITIYDIEDPLKRVNDWVDNTELFKQDLTIIVGFGLGYLAKAIIKKMEKGHHIIVIEPVAHLIKLAFKQYDFSKWIINKSLVFAYPGEQELSFILSYLDNAITIRNWYLVSEPYIDKRIEYKKLTVFAMKLIEQLKCNTGTVVSSGDTIALNDIANLPWVINQHGVLELMNLYKEKPAILVSTGPSLAKNIHLLEQTQGKAIIIAVGQALRILLAYDIKPDFICTVDFGKTNFSHYKGLLDQKTPMICANRTFAPLIKHYQGPKFVSVSPDCVQFPNQASSVLADKGILDQGGSVAHLCLSITHLMGCNPITFIGQDLALTDNKSHFNQTDVGGNVTFKDGIIKWKVTDPNSHLKKGEHTMGEITEVEGFYGGKVKTNPGLSSFITTFNGMIKQYKEISNKTYGRKTLKCFNSTEGGARIKEAEAISLQDFINKFCKKEIDKSKFKEILNKTNDKLNDKIDKAVTLLNNDIVTLDNIIKYSKKGIKTTNEIMKIINQGSNDWDKQIKGLLKKNENYSENANKESKKLPLILLAIYAAQRRIRSRDYLQKIDLKDLKSCKEALIFNTDKRNKFILETARDTSVKFRKAYVKTRNILKKFRKEQDLNLLNPVKYEPINLKDCDKYFKIDNWVWPLVEVNKMENELLGEPGEKYLIKIINKCLIMKKEAIEKAEKEQTQFNEEGKNKLLEYNDLIEKVRELGRDEKTHKEALNLAEKAYDLYQDKEDVLWGLATLYHHTKNYEKSYWFYNELIFKHCFDKPRYRFEYGQVHLAHGLATNNDKSIKDGIKIITDLMKETEEFDSFLIHIGDLYTKMKDYKKALKSYELYLKKYPGDYGGWKIKGDCLIKLNKKKEAEECYLKAAQIKGK
jgi:hypothetical protein